MDVIIGKEKVEVNILDISTAIDDVFHEKLTKKTNVTVNHHIIELFVAYIINTHNKLEIEKEVKWDKAIKESLARNGELMKMLSEH